MYAIIIIKTQSMCFFSKKLRWLTQNQVDMKEQLLLEKKSGGPNIL